MKKYIILIAILLAVIVIVQMKVKNLKNIQQPIQQSSEIKIGKEIAKDSMSKPAMEQTISPTYVQLTGCTKTFEDVILEYGKEWGIMQSKKPTFTPEETNNIITLINDYLICRVLSSNDPSNCKLFPPYKDTCEKYYYSYKFVEYMTGVNKNESECITYLNLIKNYNDDGLDKIKNIVRLSKPEKICSEIKNNPTTVCDKILSKDEEKDNCYRVFSNDLTKGCLFFPTQFCKDAYETHRGNIDCNWFDDYKKDLCEMKNSGNSICTDKLQKLLMTYCSYQENVKKKLEEFEEKKKLEEQKIQAEKEKLKKAKEEEERKKLEGEIIKKAKQAAEEAKKFKGRKYEEE